MSNNGSIFEGKGQDPTPNKATLIAHQQSHPIALPRRRIRLNYPIFRDILLALLFLVALPLEMFAPEMYKPSTWIGTRLGNLAGEQQSAQADDQISVANRLALDTADAKADAQSTITAGTADAQADAAAINAAEQADIQLVQQARIKSVLAEIDQQVQLSNTCENEKLAETHKAEVSCETEEKESYGVCLNRVRTIRERQCPQLPDPTIYPENLRDYASERVAAAKSLRQKANGE